MLRTNVYPVASVNKKSLPKGVKRIKQLLLIPYNDKPPEKKNDDSYDPNR